VSWTKGRFGVRASAIARTKVQAKGSRSRLRRRSKKEEVGGKRRYGERPILERFGKRRKITRKRIPLLRSKPHLIVRLAHAGGDSAVWERRHRKQDMSA
jgi:hypothetical protein